MESVTLHPRGRFTLASAARFIAGWEPGNRATGAGGEDSGDVRLAFLADDWTGHAGVLLRQGEPDGPVELAVTERTAADLDRVVAQAARVVSLDHDGTGFAELGRRDAVMGELQEASGFLRPVLFHSPYEAACWAVISARLHHRQAARVRDALSAEHGARLEVAGEEMLGFPAPERLVVLTEVSGISAEKVRRLHAVADAALAGRLDREPLLAAGHADAVRALQELPGIGPFWADLIFLRAVGPTDAVALGEPRLRTKAAERYGRPELRDDDAAFLALTDGWRPWRTWASVLLRAAG